VAIIVTWRSHSALAGLAVIAFVGVVANAFATGALSGPHDRYAARIAWILLLSPLLAAGQRLKASPSGRALGEGRPSPEA
jgi:hypothetical protein